MERRNVVVWLDHKAKKRSECKISLWFCNLWFPLHICSVRLVSLSYHEPPASFFWLLILWVTLSWTPLMSLKYLSGSSCTSPLHFGLQIGSQRYLLFFCRNWVLTSSFPVFQMSVLLTICFTGLLWYLNNSFLLWKHTWEQWRCPPHPCTS